MRHRPLRMTISMGVAFALACACALLPRMGWSADSGQPLLLDRTIALANVSGRIDHMAIDIPRHRLFVAELGNNSVDVIDLGSGKRLHRFTGLRAPQGIAYVRDPDVIVVANADDGSVDFFGGSDFAALGTLKLGGDADNARVDHR